MTKLHIKLARLRLLQGSVIAYPTEAVWGLGCDPWNKWSVMKLLAIKQRSLEKGLILVAASTQQFAPLYENLNSAQKAAVDDSWPGATTWLIPDPANLIPTWLKGSHSKVAIRVSAHPLVNELCQSFGSMIVSTSANQAGKPEIRSRLTLVESFADTLDFIVPAPLGSDENPSTIRDLESGKTLR